MPQIPPQPIQFPDYQRILRAQRLEAVLKPWALDMLPTGPVLIETCGVHAGGQESILLEVEGLGSVVFGNTCIS